MAHSFINLLFLDTFTHERNEDLNIDLVKFSGHPVVVREIRIVPNNTCVAIEPNIYSQGFTTPGAFSLEIFVNNLSRSAACTFEKLCSFDYRADKEIRLVPTLPIATDGLLIRGFYQVITLAIYGEPAPEEQTPPPSFASASASASSSARTPSGIPSTISPTQPNHRQIRMPLLAPVSQPAPTSTGWPAPILELPQGVAPFNPLIPPPLPMQSTSGVVPFQNVPQSMTPTIAPQQIPTLPSSSMYSNTFGFDVSRPPPSFTDPCNPSKDSISSSAALQPPLHKRKKENKDYPIYEGKPIETIGTVKPVAGAPMLHQSFSLSTVNELTLEEGEYDSDGDKFSFENISDDEFDLDESGGDTDYAELQEDLLKETRFNVYRFELNPLIHFKPPHLSHFQLEKNETNGKYFGQEGAPEFVNEFFNAIVDFKEDRNEKWVVYVERFIPNLIPTVVYVSRSAKNYSDAIDALNEWTLDGLNVNLALKQEQPAFIIRHLKIGLKLASALVQFDSSTAEKLLILRLQHKLIDLLNAEHMSLPLKLQIIRTLDSTLFFPIGYKTMTETKEFEQIFSPYQRLAESFLGKNSSRLLVAVKALFKKIHFFRLMASFTSLVNHLTKDTEPSSNVGDQRNSSSVSDVALEDDEVTEIADALHEILLLYKNAKHALIQPVNSIPTTTVFEASKSLEDPFPSIFQYFINENFLASLFLLLTCRRSNDETRILTGVCQMLNELLSSNAGLLFMCHQIDVTRELLRFSLQHNDDGHDEETIILQHLGVDLAYYMQALRLIDELMHYHGSGVVQLEVDNPGVLSTLQSFYVLTFDQSNDNRGRRAVVRVLSYENNLNSILPFVELTNDEEWDNKIKKSACAGYATELLLLVLRLSDSVELLKNFGDKLLAISCEDAGSKIADVKNWTEILRKLPNFTYESVEYLCDKIKNFLLQDGGIVPKIPNGLVTALRILKYLIVAPTEADDSNVEKIEELKYKYALMQMLSYDLLTTLIQIIDKLAETQMINWQQGISLNSHHGGLFFACVLPSLALIRSSLSYLVHCRGGEYQDVAAILPLMKMYAVCCSMLPSTGVVAESTLVQKEIVAALLSYTQPDIVDKVNEMSSDSFEIVSKSLWTRAVNEILKFTTESPYTFVAGLSVLSELLPLPLPVQTKEPLTSIETQAIESKRRLWSMHLMPLSVQLQQIVKDLTPTTHTNLQQNLRRICFQLTDLSSPIATVIVKAILNVVVENAEIVETFQDKDSIDVQATTQRRLRLPATSGLAFALNLVSYLSSHGPFKIVMIDLLRTKPDVVDQEGFSQLLFYFLDIFNYVSSERSHQLCQEHIVSILQSLCDEDIGLMPCEKSMTYEQVSCSTPEPQQLKHICVALLNHIGCPEQSYATVLPSLRIFVMLCEHDYGLYHIKKALEVERKALLSMFQRLLFEFSGHSSDCLSTLSTFVELMKLLQLPSNEFKSDVRKCYVGVGFIREILEWKYGDDTNDDHSLKKLCQMLESSAKEDDALTSLFSNVQKLVSVLSDPTSVESEDFIEPVLPPPLDVRGQFNQRQVWTLTGDDDEDRLTAHYWFPVYTLESDDGDVVDKVECDLESIRLNCFPQFDLIDELKRKFSSKRADDVGDTMRLKPGVIDTSGKHKKRYIAPLRGRPRPPGGTYNNRLLNLNRPNDAFRNRPPNTSRPPSMHVDDFIIAECQPPVAEMEKVNTSQSPKVIKDSVSVRNRAMERLQPKPVRPRPASPLSSRDRPYVKPVMTSARSFNKGHLRNSLHDRPSDRSSRKSRTKHSARRSSSRRKTPK